jgi:phage N-6-adenine-methyltransferase
VIPGFMPRNHPNTVKKQGVDDSIDDRETPPCVFDPLHAEFDFTLDAASSHQNRKCEHHCTLHGFFFGERQITSDNGLRHSWHRERVWVNPPFSELRPWVEKAWTDMPDLVCMLLPNNRQEQPFWQDMIEPFRDRPGSILSTRFLRKRRPFLHMGQGIGNRTSKNPPFGLVLVIWDRRVPGALRK